MRSIQRTGLVALVLGLVVAAAPVVADCTAAWDGSSPITASVVDGVPAVRVCPKSLTPETGAEYVEQLGVRVASSAGVNDVVVQKTTVGAFEVDQPYTFPIESHAGASDVKVVDAWQVSAVDADGDGVVDALDRLSLPGLPAVVELAQAGPTGATLVVTVTPQCAFDDGSGPASCLPETISECTLTWTGGGVGSGSLAVTQPPYEFRIEGITSSIHFEGDCGGGPTADDADPPAPPAPGVIPVAPLLERSWEEPA